MKAAVLKIRTGDEKLRLGSERFLYGLKIAKLNHPRKPCVVQKPLRERKVNIKMNIPSLLIGEIEEMIFI